jgi:hypothetical protein
MVKRPLLLLLIILSSAALSWADSPATADTKIFLDSIENDDNPKSGITVTEWFISPETLKKQPAFDPATADTPISLKAAISIGHANLIKNVPQPDKWHLDSVELDQIDNGKSGATVPDSWIDQPSGKWYYKLTFGGIVDRPDLNLKAYGMNYAVYVLMDGTLSEKRTRPQTEQEIAAEKDMSDQISKSIKESK